MLLHTVDTLDPRIGWPIAVFLWILVVLIFARTPLMEMFNVFFEKRRDKRRRAQIDRNAELICKLHNINDRRQ